MARNRVFASWSFVRIDLSEAERKAFMKWHQSRNEDILEIAEQALLSGYKLSVTYDADNESVIATLSGKDEHSPNYQKAMSARHSQVELAIALVLYKHFVMASGDAWEAVGGGFEWG